jgi:hypothetical protein
MLLYVHDRYHDGALIVVAENSEEAAQKLNTAFPNGMRLRTTGDEKIAMTGALVDSTFQRLSITKAFRTSGA